MQPQDGSAAAETGDPEPTVAMAAVRPAAGPLPVPEPPAIEHSAVEALPVHPVPEVVLPPTAPVAPPPRRAIRVFGNPFAYVVRRGFALALDLVLPTIAVAAILYGQISVVPFTGLPTNNQSAFDFTFAAAAGATFLYLVLAQAIFGTTLGKLLVGLHVYPRDGRFVGFGRALVRTVLLPLDLLAIGILLAVLPGHRRLGDLLAGTVVARSPLGAFSSLLGLIGIAVLVAAPFLLAGGPEKVFATLAAFVEFGPPLVMHGVGVVAGLVGAATGSTAPVH